MKTRFFLFSLILSVISLNLPAQCNEHAKAVQVNQSHHKDIIDVALGNSDFETLVTAVKAAGLVETLKSEGPFTVFAPTNAAFAKLPNGTLGSLLESKNKAKLTKILTYHVIAGKFKANDVIHAIKNNGGQFEIETVSGGELVASLSNGTVILTDENGNRTAVSQTDILGSNGVIHVIDSVLLSK